MSKKDQKTGNAADIDSDALPIIPGDLPEGSEQKAGKDGEEKGVETPETPPSPGVPKDPEHSKDDRQLKISVLASGRLFAAGMKAADIDPDVVEMIPSKYFEGAN